MPHGRRFHVKDPHGVTTAQQVQGGGIVNRVQQGIVDDFPGISPDGGQGVPNHRQRAVAKEVDLYQAGRFRLILFPLDDIDAFSAAFHRHITGNPIRGQDNASAVGGQMPGQGFQAGGELHDFRPGRVEGEGAKFGVGCHPP